MQEKLTVTHLVGECGIEDGIAIRKEVFVQEQGIAQDIEQDGLDRESEHYIGYIDSRPVAVARIRLVHPSQASAKIDRLAVVAEKRGQSLGSQIMINILSDLQARGLVNAELQSPRYLMEFYRQLGFIATGKEFVEAGRLNRVMYRPIN